MRSNSLPAAQPAAAPPTLCVGSAHWDLIARADRRAFARPMSVGDDAPGRLRRTPGGVALNIAHGLARRGAPVGLCAVIGVDDLGRELVQWLDALEIDRRHVIAAPGAPTDAYVAIEDGDGELVAAIADTATLDAATDLLTEAALAAISKGVWPRVIVEANLSARVLERVGLAAVEAGAELVANPVTPTKAERLKRLLSADCRPVLICNKAEADALVGSHTASAAEAARALTGSGASMALVTNGPRPAALATTDAVVEEAPRPVDPRAGGGSVTGAGDAVLAGFLTCTEPARDPARALRAALDVGWDHMQGGG